MVLQNIHESQWELDKYFLFGGCGRKEPGVQQTIQVSVKN